MGIVVKSLLFVFNYTLFNWWFISIVSLITAIKLFLKYTRQKLICPGRINGKTVIVTGGNTGLGLEIATTLAKRGARVILGCRNMGSAHMAKASILEATGNRNIDIKQLDLSSLWSVRQFAKNVIDNESRLDILIHTAGVAGIRNSRSRDDLQVTWQVNYLGPFLLTNLLLDLLKRSSPSRIIFLSSTLHHFHKLKVEDINSDKAYSPFYTYCDTMMAIVLAANSLADKLRGTGITVNTTNPGLVKVKLLRRIKNAWFQHGLHLFLNFFAKTLEEGAATTIKVAVDPELEELTGQYFSECKLSKCLSSTVRNKSLSEILWTKSEELVDMKEYERLH